MVERTALHAYLSPRAHEAWTLLCEENGCSVTGMLESMGRELADELMIPKDGEKGIPVNERPDATDLRRDEVKRARKVDAERRRRGAA